MRQIILKERAAHLASYFYKIYWSLWKICHFHSSILTTKNTFFTQHISLAHSFLHPLINIRGGGGVGGWRGWYLLFEIWTKWGVIKKLLKNRGLVERGSYLRKGRGVSKLFHQFSLRKACVHYYWNFCLVNIHTAIIISCILSCGLLFTRKWYIIFLLPFFLNIILWIFYN